MAQDGSWLTPKEIREALGGKKAQEVLNDLVYEKRSRRELLDDVVSLTGCNEYSAEDFLRDLVKNPPQ